MAAKGGKVFLLLVFLVSIISVFVVTSVDCNSSNEEEEEKHIHNHTHKHKQDGESLSVSDRQEIQVQKLESLVQNLTQLVTRLESSLLLPDSHSPKRIVTEEVEVKSLSSPSNKVHHHDAVRLPHVEEDKIAAEPMRGGGASVTKYNPTFSERFQFLSAVKIESEATCINVLPFEDYEGFSKYIAVGDERGIVYVFLPNGDVLAEFHTLSESPITAMLSYMSFYKNESLLVTGHQNGAVLIHRLWEIQNGEDWHSLSMENFRSSPPSSDKREEQPPITILELHQVGRMRYIVVADVSGKIRIMRENGTLYGSVVSKGRPLAFVKQRLLFLSETGAGSLDLRSMKIRESECEGMNHSIARSYVFDVSDKSKAYGFTLEGDLIHVVLLGDVINFKCRVRSKRKFEMEGPLVFQAIKGYLLVVNEEKVFVYNISSQHYIRVGAPRPLFFASLDEIRSSFLNLHGSNDVPKTAGMLPLITTDREKLIVLGLGSGYVGMYRSNLPIFNTEFNTMLWTSPVLVFLLFLFGVWHFFGKKKESLTLWGPEDPFASTTSVAAGAMVGSSSGDRSLMDSSSRTSDLRDLRGGALRDSSRRYVSPSRYSGGAAAAAAAPFRPNPTEPNFRATSTDHNFRAAPDLKYRGASLETTGFPKRRETLYPNSQTAVEDNIANMN